LENFAFKALERISRVKYNLNDETNIIDKDETTLIIYPSSLINAKASSDIAERSD
jgi:hypothetical protein